MSHEYSNNVSLVFHDLSNSFPRDAFQMLLKVCDKRVWKVMKSIFLNVWRPSWVSGGLSESLYAFLTVLMPVFSNFFKKTKKLTQILKKNRPNLVSLPSSSRKGGCWNSEKPSIPLERGEGEVCPSRAVVNVFLKMFLPPTPLSRFWWKNEDFYHDLLSWQVSVCFYIHVEWSWGDFWNIPQNLDNGVGGRNIFKKTLTTAREGRTSPSPLSNGIQGFSEFQPPHFSKNRFLRRSKNH